LGLGSPLTDSYCPKCIIILFCIWQVSR
jgi:hypothetical protein